jgi:hypothetical protein
MIGIADAGAVAHQAAIDDDLPVGIARRQAAMLG